MKTITLISIYFLPLSLIAQPDSLLSLEAQNKKIAQDFYQDLWFTNNTDRYDKYVAETYTAHDIGDRKNSQEAAVRQKEIADFFWKNGRLDGKIDYQIANGNLVATRWTADFEPETLVGKIFIGDNSIPIINVLRIENGKIIEFWNHRHDIDTNQTIKYTFKGFLFGLVFALASVFLFSWLRRRRATASA